MQFTTLSVAFFAALASAHAHNPQHFHHRRQYNTTSTAGGELTTLTVLTTHIHTVTSCAATVIDCPARTSPVVVTDVIALTTTVCPVAEAESASSAALASYSATGANTAAGGLTTPSVPLGTGNSGPAPTSAPSGGESGSGGEESSVVLTYTLGSGTSTTVVTTTIKHTQIATVYATIPGSGTEAEVTGAEGAVNTESAQPTTTLTGTSTSTKYITVLAASTGGASGSGAAGGAESEAAATGCAPVTVTVALSTVTVTETATPTPASGAEGAVSAPSAVDNEVGSSSATDTPVVILSTQTVQPIPVSTAAPYGNGTNSGSVTSLVTPSASFFPSGFISKTKSAEPSAYPTY